MRHILDRQPQEKSQELLEPELPWYMQEKPCRPPSVTGMYRQPPTHKDSYRQPPPTHKDSYRQPPTHRDMFRQPLRDSYYQPSDNDSYYQSPTKDSYRQWSAENDTYLEDTEDRFDHSEQPEAAASLPWYSDTPESRKTLPSAFLCKVKRESCSRSNFAANLVRKLFSVEERRKSNVRGKLGKQQLDPNRMEQIRQATMEMYPCETRENEAHVWTYCCKAVDESCRRLNRAKENVNPN